MANPSGQISIATIVNPNLELQEYKKLNGTGFYIHRALAYNVIHHDQNRLVLQNQMSEWAATNG
jgi:hypothetical protein